MTTEVSTRTEDLRKLADLELDITMDCKTILHKVCVIGKRLKEAQLYARSYEGGFQAWINEKFHMSRAWAYSAIQAYDNLGECPTVGHMSIRAIFMLACDSVPGAVRKEAIEAADSGIEVTAETVKQIKAKHQPRKEPQDERSFPLVQGSDEEPAVRYPPCDDEPYTCPNCGGHECDEDGDCESCLEPAAPVAKPKKSNPVESNIIEGFRDSVAYVLNGIDRQAPYVRLAVAEYLREMADRITTG